MDKNPYPNPERVTRHRAQRKNVPKEKLSPERAVVDKGDRDSPSPNILENVPRRPRSKRRVNQKYEVTEKKQQLSSGVFDTYLQKLWMRFSEEERTSFTYLDCLWFNLYRKDCFKEKVLEWVKGKRIFTKNYVFVPIVCWGHWSLLILCHFGENLQARRRSRCMILLDSLEKADPKRIEPDVRKFVSDICKAEGRAETEDLIRKIPLLVPKVPQQRNGDECGNYALYFIQLFMERAPKNFSICKFPYFMKEDWFTPQSLEIFFARLDSTQADPPIISGAADSSSDSDEVSIVGVSRRPSLRRQRR